MNGGVRPVPPLRARRVSCAYERASMASKQAAAAAEYMKWLALAALVIQNTALVLLMRSSLTAPGEHYIMTTAVACMEGLKIFTCLLLEGWVRELCGTNERTCRPRSVLISPLLFLHHRK